MLFASCAVAALAVTGNILLGRKMASGWALALVNQCILLWMGVASGGYGLCVMASINAAIATRNGLAWRRAARTSPETGV